MTKFGRMKDQPPAHAPQTRAMTTGVQTAEIDGEFVVFLIGMRINKPWQVHRWWPVFRAMRPMIKEVLSNPESGCLGVTFGWPVIVVFGVRMNRRNSRSVTGALP